MGVTTIYQRISKLPGVCIHSSGLGLVSWRRVPYLNLTPVTFRVPSSSRASQLYTLLSRLPRHIPRHNLLSTYLRTVFFPLDTPVVIYFRSSRQSPFEYCGFLSKHPSRCQLRSTIKKLTSPVTPQSTFAYQQHTTSMIMTPLQFTISSFLTLFTCPLTRHDPMSMSRNDLNPSNSNDSYGCFSNPSFLNLRYCVVSIFAI